MMALGVVPLKVVINCQIIADMICLSLIPDTLMFYSEPRVSFDPALFDRIYLSRDSILFQHFS